MIPQGTEGEPNDHDLEMTSETGHQPPPRSQLCIRFRHRGLSRTGRAWMDRPLDLQRKGARTGGAPGGDARSRGEGEEDRLGKSPWCGSWCWARGRSPWWSGRPPPASTAAAATPCGRRRTSRGLLPSEIFPVDSPAGRRQQRGVIMHTVVNLWRLGRLRRPFPSPVFWPRLAFAFNPLTFLSFYSRVVGCVYLAKKFGFWYCSIFRCYLTNNIQSWTKYA